jgi:TRAP-type mannitol/chloroaromatic compound transport system substrate-binding protein
LKSRLGLLSAAVTATAVFVGSGSGAEAQTKIRWKMQSAFGSQLPHLGPSGQRFQKDVDVMSGGVLEIRFYEPGALIPALECFDAVGKGSVEACWTTPGFHASKFPAMPFFTTVPFGPNFGEFLAWKWFGGGNKLRDEIYAQNGLVAFDSFCIGPETSGWFRREIKDADDMKGIKMRFFGLGAKVMEKMGVQTQLIAPADIFPALERGVIDATEFSMPTMDQKQGFHQIAKFNYFPGWHQLTSCSEILMNKAKFDALSEQHRKIIEVAATSQVAYTFAESESAQFDVMAEMQTKNGVKFKRWSDEDLAKYEQAWLDVIKEESAKDPLFKKISDHYLDYRKKYAIWGDSQYMRPTYLKK